MKKIQVKPTFITSASRSSIFVESGSSLWRLTSSRSVLAASSGCFTSTDMVVSSRSNARFVVVSQCNRALQEIDNRILDQSTVRRPKTGPGLARLIFNIRAYIIKHIMYSRRTNQRREWSRKRTDQSSRTFTVSSNQTLKFQIAGNTFGTKLNNSLLGNRSMLHLKQKDCNN